MSIKDKMPYEYQLFWENWNDIEGDADVAEYWIPLLINFIIGIILYFLSGFFIFAIVRAIFLVAVAIPNFTVLIRRFHDTNRTGWYSLWSIIPIFGWYLVIKALIEPSKSN